MNEKIIQYVVDEDLVTKIQEIHSIVSEMGHGKASFSQKYSKPEEVREVLGISKRTEFNWIKEKILHPNRVGNKRYYNRTDIEKLLAENQDNSENPE